jgi:hypothetical protein
MNYWTFLYSAIVVLSIITAMLQTNPISSIIWFLVAIIWLLIIYVGERKKFPG